MISNAFDEIFGMTNSLLYQLKAVLVHGTDEEKRIMLNRVKLWRQLMQARLEKLQAKHRFSPIELNLLLTHISNSPEYRDKLLAAQQELETHKNDFNKLIKNKKPSSIKTRSKWVRS
jgi:hypothetical protein